MATNKTGIVEEPFDQNIDFGEFGASLAPLSYDTSDFATVCLLIFLPGLLGLSYAVFEFVMLRKMKLTTDKLESRKGETPSLKSSEEPLEIAVVGTPEKPGSVESQDVVEKGSSKSNEERIDIMFQIAKHIADGSNAFIGQEYLYLGVFIVIVAALLGPLINWPIMVCFIVGSTTSGFAGWFGMKTATFCNVRTAFGCWHSLSPGFNVALRGGSVVGFFLISLGVMNLFVLVCIFNVEGVMQSFNNIEHVTRVDVFEAICGYGLGASSVALFSRVGGGIYTKAADIGADLSGKNEYGLSEDDVRNPAVIADNVGDNVGDVAGMCADLFGSFAEATCAAMVLTARSPSLSVIWKGLVFPIMISALGILTGLITIITIRLFITTDQPRKVERHLKFAIGLSTLLQTPAVLLGSYLLLPSGTIILDSHHNKDIYWWSIGISICMGLWTGLAIGLITEYYTSHSYRPVRQIAESQQVSAATGIIYGLSLGYVSTVIPILCLILTVIVANTLSGMYGVAMAAIGMLSTLTMSLTIDVFGPIADNAGGIAEMAELGEEVRDRTDALDAAGNTTAAIGKGFAIGSAALVFLALFDAFTVAAQISVVDILDPWTLIGAIYGAMHPFWFSAWTMKSVGKAANEMVNECMEQFPKIMANEMEPDYQKCIKIATRASLREMFWSAAIVILSPLITGVLLGKNFVAGMLIGILLSGILMAISMSNTGGAWDNSKKYIEAGGLGPDHAKGSATHKNAVIGDTVGDPLKDTSGPALNILVKFSAIMALVLGKVFNDCSNDVGGPWWVTEPQQGFKIEDKAL